MPVTFKVSDVPADGSSLSSGPGVNVFKGITGPIEASFDQPVGLVRTSEHPFLGAARDEWGGGPRSDEFPSGLRSMPFTWDYLGTKLPMRFHAGFVGVLQDPKNNAVTPQLGWAVEDLSGIPKGAARS